jgi:hypothetical protein
MEDIGEKGKQVSKNLLAQIFPGTSFTVYKEVYKQKIGKKNNNLELLESSRCLEQVDVAQEQRPAAVSLEAELV